jgi:hypothetical protein
MCFNVRSRGLRHRALLILALMTGWAVEPLLPRCEERAKSPLVQSSMKTEKGPTLRI